MKWLHAHLFLHESAVLQALFQRHEVRLFADKCVRCAATPRACGKDAQEAGSLAPCSTRLFGFCLTPWGPVTRLCQPCGPINRSSRLAFPIERNPGRTSQPSLQPLTPDPLLF